VDLRLQHVVDTFTTIVGPVSAAGCYVVTQERDQPVVKVVLHLFG